MKSKIPQFAWKFVEQYLSKGIAGITTIIIAWFLEPEAFAPFSIIVVVFLYANAMVDSGFSLALIREKSGTTLDYNTLFYTNLVTSCFLFFAIYLIAPYISRLYEIESLNNLLKVSALSILFQAFIIVPRAILTKEMLFYTQFKITFSSMLIASGLGITSAAFSLGTWSLVIQMCSYTACCSLGYSILTRWPIKFIFSLERLKHFWRYSRYLLLDVLISIPFANIYLILLPKYYDLVYVGLYYLAHNIKESIIGIFVKSFHTVLFSKFASDINNGQNLLSKIRSALPILTTTIFPVITIIFLLSENLFMIALPARWHPAHYYLELLMLVSYTYVLNAFFQNIFKVIGRSKMVFYLGLIKKALTLIVLVFTLNQGIPAIIYGQIIASWISLLLTSVIASRVLQYRTQHQITDIFLPVLFCFISLFTVYGLEDLVYGNYVLSTIFAMVVFVTIYVSLIFVFANRIARSMVKMFSNKIIG